MKPHFELRRVRDFGENISDTFTFIKENFKPLMKPLLVICGFFILLNTVAYANMQADAIENAVDSMNNNVPNNVFGYQNRGINQMVGVGLFYLCFFFFIMSIFIVTYSYIAIYKDKTDDEKPTLLEVWGYFKYYFFRSLGSYFVVTLLTIAGCFLCLLPGIYLGVVFSLLLPIIIMENGSFGHAFNKCFQLIKGNWWITFGIVVVVSIIISIAGAIISMPVTILMVTKMFLKWDFVMFPLLLIFGLLINVFYLSYSVMAVSTALCYFSYEEQKEGTGILNRINTLGEKGPDTSHLPTEEY
ncbi:glycerophosphoryl diester phosphodiesterase membrane domain-containing protein [Mucilaginibacter sp. UR6-1]|uniref:glycerophosphoryl diester phosphodiesterase membrane domain-containing protein n=1 Tax=Mucilaginibacter sp. UR6-1 TaxID=1435643 RepID=UPI001E36A8A9|nr:glycerophosphoryl diester phosphodiesterase membrane domain-containing protein [Mucilaginibacter sp. UR6-1]MCC8408435.1 glycerophosphoryl diester phosphodiesterase membrane domain-containing protein [Mucilaginibacter sp. UR6-1]